MSVPKRIKLSWQTATSEVPTQRHTINSTASNSEFVIAAYPTFQENAHDQEPGLPSTMPATAADGLSFPHV